jgi:hypothetical protein
MDLIDNLFRNKHHLLLTALFAVFIVFDFKVPEQFADLIDSIIGKAVVILSALALLTVNPIVGAMGLIASYVLITRSQYSSSSGLVKNYVPSEETKFNEMMFYKLPQKTVEEEIIDNMLPNVSTDALDEPAFKPVQEKLHSAAKI